MAEPKKLYGFSFADSNPGGFGALIHAMMLALNYSKRIGATFVLVEEGKKIPRLNGAFDDLAAKGNPKQRCWEDYFTSFTYARRAECLAVWPKTLPGHPYSNDPPTTTLSRRQWYANLVNEIMQLQPAIRDEVNAVISLSTFNPLTDYALHIRRTDKIVKHAHSGVESSEVPLSLYVDETMQQINRERAAHDQHLERRVYLCTDDPQICTTVQKLFAPHAIAVVWDREDESKPTHVQRLAGQLSKSQAWEETMLSLKLLYIMANAQYIIGGRMSYFFRIAELLHTYNCSVRGEQVIKTINLKDNDVFGRAPYAPPDEPLVRHDPTVAERAKRDKEAEANAKTRPPNKQFPFDLVDFQAIAERSEGEEWKKRLAEQSVVVVENFLREEAVKEVDSKLADYRWWQYSVRPGDSPLIFHEKLEEMAEKRRVEYGAAVRAAEAKVGRGPSHHYRRSNLGVHRETCRCFECVMQDSFTKNSSITRAFTAIAGEDVEKIGEVFVSSFGKQQFETTQNTEVKGDYLFLLFLNRNWSVDSGGLVHFYNKQKNEIVGTVIPRYNRLLVVDSEFFKNNDYFISTVCCAEAMVVYRGWATLNEKSEKRKQREEQLRILIPKYLKNNINSTEQSRILLRWINIDGDSARTEHMEKQLQRLRGVDEKIRLSAITPEKLKPDSAVRVRIEPSEHKASIGEVCCVTSHLEAIRQAHAAGVDYLVVCEDDITFTAIDMDVWRLVVLMGEEDAYWDVLQLHTSNAKVIAGKFTEALKEGKVFVEWRVWHWSTGMYVMSRRGMEKMLKSYLEDSGEEGVFVWNHCNYTFPNTKSRPVADMMLYKSPKEEIRAYSCTMPYVVTEESLGSHLHPKHVEVYHSPANIAYSNFVSLLKY